MEQITLFFQFHLQRFKVSKKNKMSRLSIAALLVVYFVGNSLAWPAIRCQYDDWQDWSECLRRYCDSYAPPGAKCQQNVLTPTLGSHYSCGNRVDIRQCEVEVQSPKSPGKGSSSDDSSDSSSNSNGGSSSSSNSKTSKDSSSDDSSKSSKSKSSKSKSSKSKSSKSKSSKSKSSKSKSSKSSKSSKGSNSSQSSKSGSNSPQIGKHTYH